MTEPILYSVAVKRIARAICRLHYTDPDMSCGDAFYGTGPAYRRAAEGGKEKGSFSGPPYEWDRTNPYLMRPVHSIYLEEAAAACRALDIEPSEDEPEQIGRPK
jgi:hypothetical protein